MKLGLRYIFLVGLLGCSEEECMGPSNKVPPEIAAKKYLEDLKVTYAGLTCTEVDSDYDGYVTCTVSQQVDKGTNLISLQCATLGGRRALGCKPTPIKGVVNQN